MKSQPLALLALIALCTVCRAETTNSSGSYPPPNLATLTNRAPVSGVITHSGNMVWFDGINTRTETRNKGEVISISVTGDKWWTAYPPCGRSVGGLPSPYAPKSYPEITRGFFSKMQSTNCTKLGDEIFRSLPCWRYQEISVHRSYRGQFIDTLTNIWVFLANADFPVLMRYGWPTGWNTNADVVGIQLDVPVSPDLFACPTNLKPTGLFRIPAVPFEIEIRQSRRSTQWGWTEVTTNLLSSDGASVTSRRVHIFRDAKGERQNGPTTETKPISEATVVCNYPMGPPYWGSVRKVGEDTALSMKADVLDSIALDRRYWVVDHPVLGAFSARWSMGGDTPETNEVLRLEVRQ
jgi:hypothetical protein